MDVMKFNKNYNNNFNCEYFPIIRLAQPCTYPVDKLFKIYVNEEMKCIAQVYDSLIYQLEALPACFIWMALALTADRGKEILRLIYGIAEGANPDMVVLFMKKQN